jgi:toxin CptA
MRNAPSVSYPVGRSFLRTLLHVAALVLIWLVCGAWALLARADDPQRGLVGLVGLLVSAVLVWALRRPARGRLRWDGQDWFWSDTARPSADERRGRIRVRLDWQSGMLLEFRPGSPSSAQRPEDSSSQEESLWLRPSRWLWVEQDQAPLYWNALRRAAWAQENQPSRVPA